jgi:acetoin utilization deacetylase AcuC-like enzyme
MLLYDESQKLGLFEFGIEIPVLDSRATNAFAALKDHRNLGPKIDQWHIAAIDETITKADLLRAHSRAFVEKLFSPELEKEIIRTYELVNEQGAYHRYNPDNARLPLPKLFERILLEIAGTVQCCRIALKKGFCFAFNGGMHHAQHDFGAGFCLLNDIVIAIRKLQAENRIRSAWVIDLDAHKGDGTAALTQTDESIKTLSIHMAHGWPLDGKAYDSAGQRNPSFLPSDIDIPIAGGEDHLYVARLQEALRQMERLSRPDIAVVVCGADPYEKDELPSTGTLRLSLAQLDERDRLVYEFLKKRQIPQAYLMAGGYGQNSWQVYAQFMEWTLLDRLS